MDHAAAPASNAPLPSRSVRVQPRALAYTGIAVSVVALNLLAAQQALRLPGGQGVEDLLGWVRIDAVHTAVSTWCGGAAGSAVGLMQHLRWNIAAAYLLVDSLLFMPLYALLLLLAGAQLHQAMAAGLSATGQRWRQGLWAWTVLAVVVLLALDGSENLGGAVRIGLAAGWVWGALLCAAVLAWALWCLGVDADGRARQRANVALVGAVGAGTALVALSFWQSPPPSCTAGVSVDALLLGGFAHSLKWPMFGLAIAPVLLAAAMWFWGLGLDRAGDHSLHRASLRSGIAAIVGRSRYVLASLAVFAGLTLGLDQCRDLLLGLARWPSVAGLSTWAGWWSVLVLLVTPMAVGLLVYATWLWTRLACRVQQAGQADAYLAVREPLGHFAQGWARLLAMLPLLSVYALTAYALGDAFTAAAPAGGPVREARNLAETVSMLLLFGSGCVGMGLVFLGLRGLLALPDPCAYFNHEPGVYRLLADEGKPPAPPPPTRMARAAHWAAHLLSWVTPRRLPVVALLGMLLLRLAMAEAPEVTASAPVALAVVALALAWWMGVFGALGLVEQAQARPWLLVGVLMVGAMGFGGLSDNHALPWTQPDGATLPALRQHSATLLAVLVLLAVLAWLLVTWNVDKNAAHSRLPAVLRRWGRLGGSVLLWLLAVGALRVFDAQMPPPAVQADATRRPTVQAALNDWVKALPPGTKRVFLVASEGGGIRSAYWTAQVLQRLRAQFPDFDRASFALSGVSGGAVGMAAYSACLRQAEADTAALQACLQTGFRQQDALSPLLAVGLFEDGLARLLPTSGGPGWTRCEHPGCGSMSRALGFEREWLRAFPALAQPIQQVPAGQPHLLLNSTWVESGELSVASSLRLDSTSFPATRDVQTRLGAPLNLMAAAHVAARFPFINPLALVQPASGYGETGHLADGGYFDNSGVTSSAHLWSAMQQAFQDAGRTPPEPLLVLVRNGQKKPGCDQPPATGPEPECIVPGRSPLTPHAELAVPVLRESWGLYADLLGPAVAVLNVSGIGAHGRVPPAQMRETLGETARTGATARVLVIDQLTDASLVPLGWYLSPPARRALDQQAQGVAVALQKAYDDQ